MSHSGRDNNEGYVLDRSLDDEMKESYLRYSMSVIVARALPDVRDGLKPSQRRLLFAMGQLNLSPGAKHRKCAKICGDTSGDYHPHGEQVIYPTLVRLAQHWSMRYMLVDGQGNFGSVDGDPPAAMRYTEAKLTKYAVALMSDLDKDTVDFVPNYDETKSEPVVFPASFPNLLANGSSGIAVGMATNIPPHNLVELCQALVLLVDNTSISIRELMEVMPAPDFPTGGVICGYKGVIDAFHTGRGKIVIRGVIRVEDFASDRQSLVVDELPYMVNKARLVESIARLVNEKRIIGISDIRDESSRSGIRIVMELKRGTIVDIIINQLYKFTDLQVAFHCNMLSLDNGMPRLMDIKQMMSLWISHRIDVVRRRTRFELQKAESRAHLLEALITVLDNLDEVIRIVRSSDSKDDAKRKLIERFSFTVKQASFMLDMKIYQLTKIESQNVHAEYQKLQEKIARCRQVLSDEIFVREIIKEELISIAGHGNSPRRTKLIPVEDELSMEDLIVDEQVIILISEDDYIKRMPAKSFREQKRGGQGVMGFDGSKGDDSIKDIYVASTCDTILFFTNFGRAYSVKVWQIPEAGRRSKGRPIVNLVDGLSNGEKIAVQLRVRDFSKEGSFILLSTLKGVVKKTALSSFGSLRKKGVYAVNIDEEDEVISAHVVSDGEEIMLFTHDGQAVRFDQDCVRAVGRVARGVRGIKFKNSGDFVVSCEVVTGKETLLVVCENGYGKRSCVDQFRKTARGSSGVRSIITSKRNGKVVGALSVDDNHDVVMIAKSGNTIRLGVKDIRVINRSTQGVKVVTLKKKDLLVAMQRVEKDPE